MSMCGNSESAASRSLAIGRLGWLSGNSRPEWTAVILIGLAAAAAPASPLLTVQFTDLDTSYRLTGPTSGEYTARASALALGGPFDTSGDVTRIVAPASTAHYHAGFLSGSEQGPDFVLELTLTNVTAQTADAFGTFSVVDQQGDMLSGSVNGQFTPLGTGFSAFTGLVSNAFFTENSGDGRFDGPSGGGFPLEFPGARIFHGAQISLLTGGWFQESFENQNSLFDVSLVPEPAALLMLAAGGLLLTQRQRRL